MPYTPRTLGLKWSILISHLQGPDVLRVTCPTCQHRFTVAPHHLYARFPRFLPIVDAARRMRCTRCPHRGEMYWVIERAVPPVS